MNKLDILGMGFRNLWRRKLRTFLTVLSVVIGATSIVVMLSFGFAIQKQTAEMVESIGGMANLNISSYAYGDHRQQGTKLDRNFIRELERREHVLHVVPVKRVNGAYLWAGKYCYMGEILGIEPEGAEFLDYTVKEGRDLKTGDDMGILIGEDVLRWGFTDVKANMRGQYRQDQGDEYLFDPFKEKNQIEF